MIEKMLDKYFLNKFKMHISNYLLHWYIDTRFVETQNYINLQIKKPKYKEENYKCIYSFYKKSGLEYILEEERYLKSIKEAVEKYLEENRGE